MVRDSLPVVFRVLIDVAVERGHSVLAKSVNPSRIKENYHISKLDSNDMKELGEISSKEGLKRYGYPAWNVNLGFPDKQ